jgi:GAF domain-containing protein
MCQAKCQPNTREVPRPTYSSSETRFFKHLAGLLARAAQRRIRDAHLSKRADPTWCRTAK